MRYRISCRIVSCIIAILLLILLPVYRSDAQKDPKYNYQPIKISSQDSDYPYLRLLLWTQVCLEDSDLSDGYDFKVNIKRSRMLAYGQLSPKLLLISHFGINNLNSNNMDPLGSRNTAEGSVNSTQLFLHAAWSEYKVSSDESLYLGAGLHYWNGLSRFSSASTLNFMTMDNYRQSWSQLGLSDQFGRHMGIYAKGEYHKFRYSMALNQVIRNALGSDDLENLTEGSTTYSGNRVFGDRAKLAITGRVEYQLLDSEGSLLPYRTGTYLGTKKVLNIGAGFFNHRNGTVTIKNGPVANDVNHFAADIYYDAPIGLAAINFYASYFNFNYGENYQLNSTYGTGQSLYAQLGYLLPYEFSFGKFMPYVAYSQNHFDAYSTPGKLFQMGCNWLIHGHNAKMTIEYRYHQKNTISSNSTMNLQGLYLQTQIYL